MAQRIIIVWQSAGISVLDNQEEVNGLLNEGWSVVSVTPMFGAGPIGNAASSMATPLQVRFAAVMVLQQ